MPGSTGGERLISPAMPHLGTRRADDPWWDHPSNQVDPPPWATPAELDARALVHFALCRLEHLLERQPEHLALAETVSYLRQAVGWWDSADLDLGPPYAEAPS